MLVRIVNAGQVVAGVSAFRSVRVSRAVNLSLQLNFSPFDPRRGNGILIGVVAVHVK